MRNDKLTTNIMTGIRLQDSQHRGSQLREAWTISSVVDRQNNETRALALAAVHVGCVKKQCRARHTTDGLTSVANSITLLLYITVVSWTRCHSARTHQTSPHLTSHPTPLHQVPSPKTWRDNLFCSWTQSLKNNKNKNVSTISFWNNKESSAFITDLNVVTS
jgi:hypothetical protein